MEDQPEEKPYFRVSPKRYRKSSRPIVFIVISSVLSVAAISWMAKNYEGFARAEDVIAERPQFDIDATATETPRPTSSPTSVPIAIPTIANTSIVTQSGFPFGTIVFDGRKLGFSHLWFYLPGELEPQQLTFGNWDDRHPAFNPDGSAIAFASHQNGNWDLYLLQLATGEVRRLTATLGFEGRPAWSPDGQWLAYEAYYEGNYDIWILPLDEQQEPFRLTSHPALDRSPSWSSDGRSIAFISNRENNFDLFFADLDAVEDRFTNLTHSPEIEESMPRFEPEGSRLAFVANTKDSNQIFYLDLNEPERNARVIGPGDYAVWSPDGLSLAIVQYRAYESFLVSYNIDASGIPPLGLSVDGTVLGIDWHGERFRFVTNALNASEPLYERIVETPIAQGRYSVIRLPNLSAPNPFLSDLANEAFQALRERTVEEIGWDLLGNLDGVLVGINDPLPPGFAFNDWLYTGRAFAISEAIVGAGWVEVQRENVAGQTYWRLYVRVRFQDGSQGEPLRSVPWDFSGREGGDPTVYDQGGSYRESVPKGYYVDFTALASDYGFLRQAALHNWRTYYAGTRYKEFALSDGLSWEEAMLQIYPSSAIITPTPFQTPTKTPTRTPWWIKTSTPTPSQTSTPTPAGI